MHQPVRNLEVPQAVPEFSLVLGGPLYHFCLRTRLARPPIDLVRRRILALWLVCWIPPLLLSLFSRTAFGRVKVPFLLDIGANVRFLRATPLLIAAELVAQRRIPGIVRQFFDRRIIASSERARFEKVVISIMRFRNSAFMEILLALSAFAGFWMWQEYPTLGGSTWYVDATNGKLHFTAAGYWYWFLWRVQRFPLHHNFLHPDLAGGLGFLSGSITALALVLGAQTMIAAGVIADEIRYAGMALPSFKMEIAAILIFLLLLVFAPLCFFMVQLIQAGRKARRKYGMLASRYVDDFWNKWFAKHGSGSEKQVLGASDIQSLADLANAYTVVNKMRVVPFGTETVIRAAILICLPLLRQP